MIDPTIIDGLTRDQTPAALRHTLLHCELSAHDRAHIITAIHYLEGTDND